MATNDSPSVDVQIIDESFYDSGVAGTIPLILIATHKNKVHPSGIGIAQGTLPENAGKLSVFGSQRDLIQYFGVPKFYTDDIGTAMHGYELNEYGLHAAYDYLSTFNRVYVIDAAIDLNQLQPTRYEPNGNPIPGTFWFDTKSSAFGVHVSDGSAVPGVAWKPKSTTVINDIKDLETIVIGNVSYAGPDATVSGFAGFTHQLVINGNVVTIHENSTLRMATAAVNDAGIVGITAAMVRLAGRTYFTLRNNNAGPIDLSGTPSNDLATAFGTTIKTLHQPKSTIGMVGDFAVVTVTGDNIIYQKMMPLNELGQPDVTAVASWCIVGSDEWKKATPTVTIGSGFTGLTPNSRMKINGSIVDFGTKNSTTLIAEAINTAGISGIKADAISSSQLRIVNTNGGPITLLNDVHTPVTQLGLSSVKGNELYYSGHTKYPSGSVVGDVWIKTTEYNSGAKWAIKTFSATTNKWVTVSAPLVGGAARVGSQTQLEADDAKASAMYGAPAAGVLYVNYDVYANGTASHTIRRFNGTAWEDLVYSASTTAPTAPPDDGTLWFNDDYKVDIMVNLDGSQWVGYRNHPFCTLTDAQGPFLQASQPLTQRDGTPLEQNDLWIDTTDTENYPLIRRFQASTRKWETIDLSDQTTPFGIVFDDARENAGALMAPTDLYDAYSELPADMLLSNCVDPDCVDPRLYPDGMLLFNLRYSTKTVKKWNSYYFAEGGYSTEDYTTGEYMVGNATMPALNSTGRWVTVSGKKLNGSPYMGRKAQRRMIVESMQQAVLDNDAVRAETIYFNIMAAPGYVELVDELISLNVDKKQVAYCVGDTPIRLQPTAQAIQTWVTPSADAQVQTLSEDALGVNNPYVAMYYPWGLTTNIDGAEVVVPPSTIALRVFATNDAIAYPWYAPAGYTRGAVTNATSVGYLTAEGEFKPVFLNEPQRDSLYLNDINPIAYIPNRGLVVFGQKSIYGADSSLDRVNVGRLANYLRYNCDNLAQQFLFEPNTPHTRDTARITFERMLANLISLEAIYDFVVVCDDSNNTPSRIDRNELWIDIAIQPVKAIEFIIIPVRFRNTGDTMTI